MSKVQNIIVNKEDNDIRIDRWFKRNFPNFSHISIEKALRKGQIRVNGKRAKAATHVMADDEVRVPPMVEYEKKEKPKYRIDEKYIEEIQKSVIFKDNDIIVINKPAGLAVQGGVGVNVSVDALLDYLKFDYEERPKLVHRLDKDTSGILVIARKTSVASSLSKSFKSKDIEKIYWALVVGTPEILEGKIDLAISKQTSGVGKEKMMTNEDGDKAITYYKVLENIGNKVCLVELHPITGRTHQLRVHMAEIGTPILGDGKYGSKKAFIDGLSKKMHLHARQIKLPGYKKPFVATINQNIKQTFEMLGIENL